MGQGGEQKMLVLCDPMRLAQTQTAIIEGL